MQLHELDLELLGCSKTQTGRGGVFVALFAATAPNGATGHLSYVYEWDKRDVVQESVYVSDEALWFDNDESPSALDAFEVRESTENDPTEHAAWSDCIVFVWGD